MNPASKRWVMLLAALCLAVPGDGFALEDARRYRVELIVFRHLDGQVKPAEVDHLQAFTRAFDPASDETPDELRPLPELSPPSQAVWDRLARSAGYRPMAWAAWEQDAVDYSPPVRVHGEEPLRDADGPLQRRNPAPCSDLLSVQAAAEPGMNDDPMPACEPFNRPDVYYELDGQAQLRRTRFLHLDVHVVHREAGGQVLPQGEIDPETGAARLVDAQLLDDPGSRWRVIELRQSRQVRPGEYHYFDGPVFGAIARVTEIDPATEAPGDA